MLPDIKTREVVSIDPSTGEIVERFPLLDAQGCDTALAAAVEGFENWRTMPVSQRADALRRIGDLFRAGIEPLARTITREMGKPIKQARAEVSKCAALCDWYADHGAPLIADEATTIEGEKAYVSYLPIGVVLGVMPWNFPLWQVMRAAVPIMLAGNGFLLKHAPNVLRSAFNITEIFAEAGVPRGAFSVLDVDQDDVAAVIADDRIAAVTLTGSVRAGAAVAAEAGRNIKKSVLELGGSDPFIILADADLDRAVAAAVAARFQNSGQVCIAAKRIIVERSIARPFTKRFLAAVAALKIGDPQEDETDIGPLARTDIRDEIERQVARSVKAGAVLLTGGKSIGSPGTAYFQPTVLDQVRPGMAAFDEETFGPVAAIVVAEDAEDALRLANTSQYGLSGAIWTEDVALARSLARRMETGGVFINGYAASDPRVPIGGIRKSGYGRELSHFGIREFCNAQLVWQDRS